MSEKIHTLRKRIDELIFETETRAEGETYNSDGARALALVRTKLQEAKMWSGKILEAQNKPLPKQYRDNCEARENEPSNTV